MHYASKVYNWVFANSSKNGKVRYFMITRNDYSILKVNSHIKLAIISPKSSSPQIIGLMPKEINVCIF
jgi:hypothetical protein